MKRLLLSLLLIPITLFGQDTFTIKGKISSQYANPLALISVKLEASGKSTQTNDNGVFEFKNVKAGTYVVSISGVGFKSTKSTINVDDNLDLTFILQESSQAIQDVNIIGKSKAMQLSEQAININALDVSKVVDLSLGAEEVLRASTGVVVRQSGGLGSEPNINLNGLTGEAVRIYYDGIPMEVYGNALQLNTVPVDALQRIDVYKGVMPIDVGTDALGGGINLIPVEPTESQLRASYSVGSFNTHRLTLNGNKNWNNKTSLSISSFYNYSDNDYTMRNIRNNVERFDENGDFLNIEREYIDARRFHDQHASSFVEAALSLKNRGWADRLVLSFSHSYRFDEIQQGKFIDGIAVGEAESKVNGLTQRVDYRKKFMDDKLSLRYFGILSNAFSKVNDSTKFVYNWTGAPFKRYNDTGSEIFSSPTARGAHDLGTSHRLIVNYQMSPNTAVKFSDFFSYTRIKGEDPFGIRLSIDGQQLDPNTIPSKISRNIVGVELEQLFFEKKLTAIGFYKNYKYAGESIDLRTSSATILPIRKINDTQNGYGAALKYSILPSLFVRGSVEKAVRIPTEPEIFGDFLVILPNYELKPETSDNINAGISFSDHLGEEAYLSIKIDGFLRNQKNLIRIERVGIENARYINQAEVDGKGVEFSSRLTILKSLDISANLTYQSNKIAKVGKAADNASIGRQVPNIPNFYYNLGVDYKIEDIFRSQNSLRLFWTYFYTDRFSINEVGNLDTASPEYIVPVQHLHNAGATYSLVNRGLSFSFNVQNALNAEIFDNFRIPRPGFNCAFKINYTLSKK
ncbi:TonB-dependent receptor [Sphingobacterium sp. DN00404]|uniref:TonB-dependent receptor n=1 Tax=Sphingobacterium micropteri TaxID=2763501 RepID=A0ABR7YUB3_9SPHI|nr:TonB-dependent receptor [Sphingobacterium micropteri]MBD1434899.1 TonB-dependent receptor [Sphingobacterium micropteri]